ncbi:MAG: hypothetical protein WAT74_13190 [Flavobacteriales bacterium]
MLYRDRSSLCILQAVLFAALLLPARSHGQSPLLLELRKETGAMFKDEAACERVLKQLASADTRNDAVLKGYLGAATIARASHAVNPFRKLAYFNDGKELLESAVATDNSSLELRFLRLSIQVNAPSFLGYRAAIAEDRAYIDANLDRVASPSFRESIVRFIAKVEAEGKL